MMRIWFQRPPIQHPSSTPTQPNSAFHPPAPPVPQNSSSASAQPKASVSGTPVSTTLPCEDPIDSNDVLPDLGHLSGCRSSDLPASSSVQSDPTSPTLLPENAAGPSVILTLLHEHPRLFEHEVGRPIMFCVPITLKDQGRIAGIFRVSL